MRPVYVNGKFLSAVATGVQRAARSLLVAMDKQLAADDGPKALWALLLPPGDFDIPEFAYISPRAVGPFGGNLWEQTALPLAARGGVTVNLANSGPLFHSRNIVMFHDAQVYITPASYSRPFRAWYKFMQPRLGAKAKTVVTVSNYSARKLVKYGVVGHGRIEVIPNAVEDAFKAPTQRTVIEPALEEKRYFLAFTSSAPHKNTRLLLDAFHSEALASYRLALIGNDIPKDVVLDHARVTLLGRVSDDALKSLLRDAVALLFPSTTEGFGLPPLEAMACGCPVIAADAGAIPEACGDAAILLTPQDESSWVEAMLSLAEDDALRRNLILKGEENVTRFSWPQSAKKLIAIVNQAARGEGER